MPKDAFAIFLSGIVAGSVFFVFTAASLDAGPKMLTEFSFTPSDLATLVAGFGGAVVGGGISWLLARQTALETRKRDEEDRNAQTKAKLLQTTLKVMQVSNGIFTIHRIIEDSLEEARNRGTDDAPLWAAVRPVAGRTKTPRFESSDFVPFATYGQPGLINSIIKISDRYEAIENAFYEYCELRRDFKDFSAPYTFINNKNEHATAFPDELRHQANLYIYEMDQLINGIKSFIEEDLKESKKICKEIDKFNREHLKGKGGFVSIEADDI